MNARRKPRIEKAGPISIAGIQRTFDSQTMDEIPKLWERLGSHLGKIPGQVGGVAYGAKSGGRRGSDEFDYIAGAEVKGGSLLPGFVRYEIPALTYAVFDHNQHISKIRRTIMSALDVWLPDAGLKRDGSIEGGLEFFERYDEEFDPRVAVGHAAIWIPVKP